MKSQKIWIKSNDFDKMESIYSLLLEFWRGMMLATGDFMKMLFWSFWLTMARVKNLRLKSASFVSYVFLLVGSLNFKLQWRIFFYACIGRMCVYRCMLVGGGVCERVYVCECVSSAWHRLLVYFIELNMDGGDGWMDGLKACEYASTQHTRTHTHTHATGICSFLCIGMHKLLYTFL